MSVLEILSVVAGAQGLGILGLAIAALVYQGRYGDAKLDNKDLVADNDGLRASNKELGDERDQLRTENDRLTSDLASAREQLDKYRPDSDVRTELRGGVPDVPQADDGQRDQDKLRAQGPFATELP